MTDAVQAAASAASKSVAKAAATAAAKKAKADAETAKTVVADVKNLPESVTLAAPHGFIDDEGEAHVWLQHEVVTVKDEIKLLIERGARLFGINGEPEAPAKAK
ncbi:TPA: hypothetical protein QDA99_006591 [Burkholderia vietnamiensis]|uniref:hypothetical protein n=1 Tax=Burkholderia vietnamiensis TaxID=60552 RepID=UPI00158D3697|nr:hypothetical protein [Burkholderia vietnamiensis]HDR9003046.1 hypothetical protein [Burkholderia vietnamiensis]HDR9006910.1 hypothetical protein [Burkholderia vietnamiensis]